MKLRSTLAGKQVEIKKGKGEIVSSNENKPVPSQEDSLSAYGYKQEFKRVLKLRHLIAYGLAYVTPTAPFPMLGIVAIVCLGHMSTAYLIAFVALFFTATSYAKMAYRHPVAGSAYSYSRQALHPHAGFIVGWALFLSYLLVPLLSVIAARDLCLQIFPDVPPWLWIIGFVVFMTVVNILGIKVTAGANSVMTVAMIVGAALFVILAVISLKNGVGEGILFSTKPFYNPETFSSSIILAGTALAIFSYIGFDGISTLAEEVENPRVNIGRATILVALFCAVINITIAYLAQMVWPDYSALPQDVGAVLLIAARIGGAFFRYFVFFVMIVAGVSCALAGQTSAARLMYGMGRDGMLPRKFFSYVSKKHQIPAFNLLLIAVVSVALAFVLNFQTAAEVLNYGAFIGFFAVNLCVIFEYLIRNRPEKIGIVELLRYLLMPLLGMLVIGRIFLSLNPDVLTWVSLWMLFGLTYYGILTRGFRKTIEMKLEE